MGKVIVTAGKYAKKGYLLKNTKQHIYSIEELCYCIMKTPELCEDYLYDEGLAKYIKDTLELKERGMLLADLIKREAPLKDLITVCFCSCDYFSREEIESFLKEQSKMERREAWVCAKQKADCYLVYENYRDAIMSYRQLLREKESQGIPSGAIGDIYHNLGVALLHTDGFSEAVDYFREAYERNNREESLKQYLLALRFYGDTAMYRSALDIYRVSGETRKWLDAASFQTEQESSEMAEFEGLHHLKKLLQNGKVNEFYTQVEHMTKHMKEQYRNFNE